MLTINAPAQTRFNTLLIFLVVVCLPIAGYAISLLFDASVAWSNPEYLIFSLPGSLRTGTTLQWIDLIRGFDPHLFDEIRPRFLNYIITIINVKLRLLAYPYFIPSANLSIGLVCQLLFAPPLFFVLCRKLFGNAWVALLGACLFVSTVGFLSTVVFFVQPGKNLGHTLALLLFVLLATLHEKKQPLFFGEENRRIVYAVMAYNFLCISIDELCAVFSLVGVVLFPRLFFPDDLSKPQVKRAAKAFVLYFSPFVAFLLFTLLPAPLIGELMGAGWCNYLGSFFHLAAERSTQGPFPKFAYDLVTTTMATYFFPHPYPQEAAFYTVTVSNIQAVLLAVIVAGGLALIAVREPLLAFAPSKLGLRTRATAALVVYFVFQTLLQRVGGQITGGYYYCALAALFISLWVVAMFGTPGAGWERMVVPCLVPALMVIQIQNFLDLNTRWEIEHRPATLKLLSRFNAYQFMVITPEGPRSPEHKKRMEDLWNRWRRGEHFDESMTQNWPVRDGWFLMELNALDGRIFKIPDWHCS